MYIPMTMTPKEADDIIRQEKMNSVSVGDIERILLREKMTPLQAQAALTAAWNWLLSQGRVSEQRR